MFSSDGTEKCYVIKKVLIAEFITSVRLKQPLSGSEDSHILSDWMNKSLGPSHF